MDAWLARYIGVPFLDHGRDPAGWDCWGCARWIWQEHFGITVPSYTETYQTTREMQEVARALQTELPATPWRLIDRAEARTGDGLLFRLRGHPMHVGVFLGGERFIHADPRAGTVIDRLTAPWWIRRLLGVYRYSAPEATA